VHGREREARRGQQRARRRRTRAHPELDARHRHAEQRHHLFIGALRQEAIGELERKDARDAEYLFFVRFLVGLIVTVGIVVLSIK
jgi:hypothetical protein